MPGADHLDTRRTARAAIVVAVALASAVPRHHAAAQSAPGTIPDTIAGSAPESVPTQTPTTITPPTVLSRALGKPHRGSLIGGVLFPAIGSHHITWDPGTKLTPGPDYRHWGTAEVVRRSLCVVDAFARDHPDWPKVVIGDLSLQSGGPFGREYGGLGHSSHQNGLDIDIYYPRIDRSARAPETTRDVDFDRSRELVDRFVAAGADRIFVGVATPLRGPTPIVQRVSGHRDHFHVRFPNPEQPRPTTTTTTTTIVTPSVTPTTNVDVMADATALSYPNCALQPSATGGG